MRTPIVLLSVFSAIALVAVGVWWLSSAEVVRVRAVEIVPLFDPDSLAGGIGDVPKQVGQLATGEELPVLACVDRKSDINLHAAYQGKVVAVGDWKAKIQLVRQRAYPWQVGAIASCQGFFEAVSTHA